MMTNLFSSFDLSSNFIIPLNLIKTIMGIFIISMIFWILPTRIMMIWNNNIIITLHFQFKILLLPNYFKGSTFILIYLFSFTLFNNFLGIFSYIFTSSSHLTFTLSLSLPLSLSFMIYGWLNHSQHVFKNLVHQGTPPILMPVMVCNETISNFIRPGNLSIRLTANMIAGHLLLTLLVNTGPLILNSNILLQMLIIAQLLLLLLEFAV